MQADLVVAARFCGPPGTANGGYVAGLLAAGMSGPVEVTLRAPTPVETRLEIALTDDDARSLRHSGTELARAVRGKLDLEPCAVPPLRDVAERAGSCRAMRTHPFPGCFVCGPARAHGDGLRVFPGVVPGGDAVAALWTPDPSLCDARGRVAPEFIWAALDCPSAFPLLEREEARALEPMVLAKLCVSLESELRGGESACLVAWPIAQEGRRGVAGAAIFGTSGRLVGRARATWISLAGRR
jgi:hypothetical protein